MSVALHRLRTPRGAAIAMLEYAPRRARGVALAVGHGYSSSKQNLDVLCAFLASHGFRVASVDFPGHKLGASGGTLASIDDLTDALGAAVEHLRGAGETTVYTLGHSMGAMTALRTCAADPGVAGAISIATGYGRPTALAKLAGFASVDLRSSYVEGLSLPEVAARTEPVVDATLAGLAGRPTLFVAASRDGMVSLASVTELHARAPEPKSWALVESDHTWAGENSRAAVLAWLDARHPRPAA